MKNGQLKPGYNVQMSSNNQFLTHYTIHPNPTDTLTLHLKEQQYGRLDDAMDLRRITPTCEAFVKYSYFHKEAKASFQNKRPFHPNSLHYNEQEDLYICPMGQPIEQYRNV